ncbi:MAG: CotH kinase family protein [Prevotella sp.]|nr:CotH kinase family protein [Prevotella sp.]
MASRLSSHILGILFLFTCCCLDMAAQSSLEEGTYYLLNKASGRFLMAGGNWGTQAVLANHALPLTLEKAGENTYYIHTGFDKNGDGCLCLTNEGLFLDSYKMAWTILDGQTGCHVILNPYGGCIGFDQSDIVETNLPDVSSNEAQWQFLTHAQLLRQLLTASAAHPVDATFLIADARFDRNYNMGEWEGSSFAIGGVEGNNETGNFCAEVWNANFDIHQQLENIPNGRYQLKAQGFYRYNNTRDNTNRIALQAHNNGFEQLRAELYANDASTPLQSIASEYDNMADMGLSGSSSGLPFSMAEAAYAFSAGLYTDNELTVTVNNHQLTIGVRKNHKDGCDWTIWDNIELTLLQAYNNDDYQIEDGGENYDNASPDNPYDMTSRITNPQFNSSNGWKGSPVIGGSSSNLNAEKYNTTFDVYQTINNLPDGWYRLQAQGFYRYGDYHDEQHKSYYGGGWEENDANNMYAMYTIPYAVISRKLGLEKHLAELYANKVSAGLPSPFDYAHDTATHPDDYPTEFGWVPDTQRGASGAFSDGEYPVELLVPVTNGTLTIGVKKSLGYKYDWACWDNFQLFYLGKEGLTYADGVQLDTQSLNMVVHERRQLEGKVTPATASDPTLTWQSSNTNVVEVDATGLLVAKGEGTAQVTAIANGSKNHVASTVNITVENGTANAKDLLINEIQVSNIDMFVDPSSNYGGYIELYNPTNKGVTLRNLYVSDDPDNLLKCRLTSKSGAVPPKGFGLVWFDHRDTYDGQVDFKLDMDGGTIYLSQSDGTLIASQAYPTAISRTSYARTTDGTGKWMVTAYPTPGASNAGSKEKLDAVSALRLSIPVVNEESQLFTSDLTVEVDIPSGATLHYTTDGSTPTEQHGDISVDGIFHISETTILRLRLFRSGMLPSPVKTCSYIYKDKEYMLPIISIASDPVNFFDDEMGVFVTGTNGVSGSGIGFNCNWNMDWERPAHLSYITPDNQTHHEQEMSLSRFGGWSRSWYPFNFKLIAKKEYEGLNYVNHPFFDNKPYLKHKALQMRNGGNDLMCRIKDASLQHIIISSGFHLDCQDYMPVHSFINGRYQGMLNLREPSNKHFAYANYGIDTDLMDQMELGGGIDVKVGNADAFNQWRTLSASASDADTYEQICNMVDIDEFINYMATQIFLGGDDWPSNNCKAFKGDDGKFHIVLFDIDQALRYDTYAFTHITNSSGCPLVSIFLNMLENDSFRKQFIDTYCLVAGSVFEPARCAEIIDRMSDEMNPALAWEGLSTDPTAGYVKAALTATRRTKMMEALAQWSNVRITTPGQEVKLSTNIPSGKLQLNGLSVPTNHFDGTLFAPAIIKASAPEGYVFKGWYDEAGHLLDTNQEYDISGQGALTLVATYEESSTDEELLADIAVPIKVNEVSAGNSVFINDWMKKNDWIELYNNTDSDLDVAGLYLSDDLDEPQKYQIPESNGVVNTIIPARGHLLVWADKLESLSQIHTNFKLSNTDGNMVLASSSEDFVARNADYFNVHPAMKGFVDGMTYYTHDGDQSMGRYPDGGHFFYRMSKPTIEHTNTLLSCDTIVGEDQNLMVNDQMFTLNLASGWNWVSHNLSSSVAVTQLSGHAIRITGWMKEAYKDDVFGMTGSLKTMEAGNLYKVLMEEPDFFSSEETPCRPDMPIALRPGWNWIGYPVNGTQPLSSALADYPADEGDQIIGQDGFALFSDGTWKGSLISLETGKGYILNTSRAKILRFASPSLHLNINKGKHRGLLSQRFGIDKTAHPDVMGVVAVLLKDGMPVEADRFTILAFSTHECRGAGKWVGDHAFVTLYGEGGEPLSFIAIDNYDGTTHAIKETMPFNANIEGSMQIPVVLTMEETADGIMLPESHMSTNTTNVKGCYTLSGTHMSGPASTLPPGIYVMRLADGTYHKILIK